MADDSTEILAFRSALERGVDFFNDQKFMEAYEVWEEQWQEESTDGADLLQGLLQVAVGLSKLVDGNPRGTVKLLEMARAKLLLYSPNAYGLDILLLLDTVAAWQVAAEQMLQQGSSQGVTLPGAQLTPLHSRDE